MPRNGIKIAAHVNVGLLIGGNYPRAITPRQVIPSQGKEPYAQQTDLGWRITGNVDKPCLCVDDGDSTAIIGLMSIHNSIH